MVDEQIKKCPYCAEAIKAEAIVCRFCNRDLNNLEVTERIVIERTDKKFKKHVAIAVVLLIAGMFLFLSGISELGTNENSAMKMSFGFLMIVVGGIWGLINRIRMWWDRG